jgi:hypothetical protein
LCLKEAAEEYWGLGENIVISKAEMPPVKWEEWQAGKQTSEQFDRLMSPTGRKYTTLSSSKV